MGWRGWVEGRRGRCIEEVVGRGLEGLDHREWGSCCVLDKTSKQIT